MLFLWLLITFLVGTLVGHALHWAMHKKWSGRLYRSHKAHHKLYTHSKYYSKKYRGTGKDNSALFFVPPITAAVLIILLVAPLVYVPWIVIESLAIGFVHEYLHMAFHLKGSKLRRFAWFRKMEHLHRVHHRKVHYNYGIFWFGWDRLFGSFKPTYPNLAEEAGSDPV